jgi:hypothetical protein
MNFEVPHLITPTAITVFIGGRDYTVNKGDDRYNEVRDAIMEGDFDSIPNILDIKGKLVAESDGGLYLLNGVLRCDAYDLPIPTLLSTRILEFIKEGFSVEPLTNFLSNLMANPNESGTIVEEIYEFVEAWTLPITPDGCILAYKTVRPDFKDIYTGNMDNSVGTVVEMNRDDCDFNRNRTCSSGLHFCSRDYLPKYGTENHDRVVVVKINPRDITSIPKEYDLEKGRCCRYEVVDSIDWDEAIKPWFSSEYTEPETVSEDETEWVDPFRWEVRESATGVLVNATMTRQEARNLHANHPESNELFVWDNVKEELVRGTTDLDPSEFFDPEGESEDEDSPSINPSAVLNERTVAEIRRILADDSYDTLESLAVMYGVSDRTIRRIRDWESWTHVTDY